MASTVTSWGRYPRICKGDHRVVVLNDVTAPLPIIDYNMLLPYGNGRSYGDSCLNPGGALLTTRGLDHYIHFDSENGQLECEAGMLLAEILTLVLPHGWFLPVTPGTQFVTVGGAIANDVHGKNHHMAGSFGDHVIELELLRTDGTRRVCSPVNHADWLRATIGGLGLTGLITRARLQLRRVAGPVLEVNSRRFGHVRDYFTLMQDATASEYRVAWIDCLASGKTLGRGVFMHGNHAVQPTRAAHAARSMPMPFTPPFSMVNSASLRAFNTLYFNLAPRSPAQRQVHYQPFFYPLDRITDWNRMYGPAGFLQYQCVVPSTTAQESTKELLERIAASGEGSFLVVLKEFGNRDAPGMLSFPRAGTTLAMDFPFRGERTLRLLDTLDGVVGAAQGAVYPAKDARMSPAMFATSFPELASFRKYVEPRFSSGLWRRVMGNA